MVSEEEEYHEYLDPNQLAAELAQIDQLEGQRERESIKAKRQRFQKESTVSNVLNDLNQQQDQAQAHETEKQDELGLQDTQT